MTIFAMRRNRNNRKQFQRSTLSKREAHFQIGGWCFWDTFFETYILTEQQSDHSSLGIAWSTQDNTCIVPNFNKFEAFKKLNWKREEYCGTVFTITYGVRICNTILKENHPLVSHVKTNITNTSIDSYLRTVRVKTVLLPILLELISAATGTLSIESNGIFNSRWQNRSDCELYITPIYCVLNKPPRNKRSFDMRLTKPVSLSVSLSLSTHIVVHAW